MRFLILAFLPPLVAACSGGTDAGASGEALLKERDTECQLMVGESTAPGGKKSNFVEVVTYAEHEAFADALVDSFGAPSTADEDKLTWTSATTVVEGSAVALTADMLFVNDTQRVFDLYAQYPDGSDALDAEAQMKLIVFARDALTVSPETYGCSGVAIISKP